MAEIRVKINGRLGEISLHTFLAVIESSASVLQDIDRGLSDHHKETLDWVVSGLSTGSLEVSLRSVSRSERINIGSDVAVAYVRSLHDVETGAGSPPYLTDTGMGYLRRMIKTIGRNGATGIEVRHVEAVAELTARAQVNIEQLVRPARCAIGSVEGKLDTVSVHGKHKFLVYEALTHRAVTCKFDPSEGWKEIVWDALGTRVNVSGVVHFNSRGEPLRVEQVDITNLRRLACGDASTLIERLAGSDPDFTGGMTAADYVRSIRDA